MSNNAILIYSGGLDSTVLLFTLLRKGYSPHCITFNYGQRHRREIACAREMCKELNVPFSYVDLTSVTKLIKTGGGSQLEDVPVPEGKYDAANMKTTIVPNRNMMMLSIAVAAAAAANIQLVYFAAHAGDHHIYPDCRPEFVRAFQGAVFTAVDTIPIQILAPFARMSKAEIVTQGASLGVPFEKTHSCYKGAELACGRCGTCVERLEAFHIEGVTDPLQYADREYWRTVCQNTPLP